MTELCAKHGISRKTGYKWLARYDLEGRGGLADRSRAPKGRPRSTPQELVDLIVETRKQRPAWGPRKLKAFLERQHPGWAIPAASTIGRVLKQHGLISPPRREKRAPTYPHRLVEYTSPNRVWCADFKGPLPLRNGRTCSPVTISDGYSRYLLRCELTPRMGFEQVKPVFESAFAEFGLPEFIRTDNGPPFASRAPGGLSRLSIWWTKLGILPERIQPGKPTQNGRHERLHRTLQAEAVQLPRKSLAAQQRVLDRFRYDYNELRPHEGLGNRCPAEFYNPSPRRYPCPLVEPVYGPAFTMRIVNRKGEFKWKGQTHFASETLRGEHIGIRWSDELQAWSVEYGALYLGFVPENGSFKRPKRT